MTAERYVVLGLAHVRSAWHVEVARWSTSGSIPVEFLKCVSIAELRARLAGGRRFSAALLDGRLPAVDRDLMATLADHGIAAIVVGGPSGADWPSLGTTVALPEALDRTTLLDALAGHAAMVDVTTERPTTASSDTATSATWRGRLVAVTGSPGAGTSTIAAAVAQGITHDPRYSGDVVLADLARRAHQALLHDARDVVPGIQELVEAHRSGRPTIEQHRALTFDVAGRGYRLLLGLRRPRDWVSIRSQSFTSALDGLRRSARVVVADTDSELEGEAETGSFDIEDRHLVARTTVRSADLVVVVTTPSITGLHGLLTQLSDLRSFGIDGSRTLVVVNRAPSRPRNRAELTRAIAALSGAADRPDPYVGPVFVPDRRNVDALHRDIAPLPQALTGPPTAAIRAMLDELPAATLVEQGPAPVAIAPGTLGTWGQEESAQ